MSLTNLVNLVEDLVYRRSTRESFYSCTEAEAGQRYGLSPAEVSMVRRRSSEDYRAAFTFTLAALESCFPNSFAAFRIAGIDITDCVDAVFDRADTGHDRVLNIAEYLWHKAVSMGAPNWLYPVIDWEVALISPPGKRDFGQLQTSCANARLIQTQWDINAWTCREPDGPPLVAPTKTDDPRYYIIVPDQFARNARYARFHELSECVFLVFESYIGDSFDSEDGDALKAQFENFCRKENIAILEAVRLTDHTFCKNNHYIKEIGKMDISAEEVLKAIKEDESLRKEILVMLSRDFPREYLSRVKLDPGRVSAALGDVIVSCKEWQE